MEKQSTPNVSNSQVELSPLLVKRFKVGIYRELYKKGLIPKKQLDALIKLQNIEAVFPLE